MLTCFCLRVSSVACPLLCSSQISPLIGCSDAQPCGCSRALCLRRCTSPAVDLSDHGRSSRSLWSWPAPVLSPVPLWRWACQAQGQFGARCSALGARLLWHVANVALGLSNPQVLGVAILQCSACLASQAATLLGVLSRTVTLVLICFGAWPLLVLSCSPLSGTLQ